MKLYLDTCVLHRPFDDQSQHRIALETQAVFEILAQCDAGTISLVSSDALLLEIDAGPDSERRRFAHEVLATATCVIGLEESIERRGNDLETLGFTGLDALHLAFAESAGVDYFCTCDDRLLKKATLTSGLRVNVVSPTELARKLIL